MHVAVSGKDARTFGWLILMSLLQVVVAVRYSRGVAFGGLVVVYGVIGMLGLALFAFAQRGRGEREPPQPSKSPAPVRRWPLANMERGFISTPAGGGRAGIVPELFARLALIVVGRRASGDGRFLHGASPLDSLVSHGRGEFQSFRRWL